MTTAPVASSRVDDLADRFWNWFLEIQPLWATVLGDDRYDDRWDDPSDAGRAREIEGINRLLADADAIDSEALDSNDRITLDMLRVVANLRLESHRHRIWQIEAVDQLGGPQTLPGELARFQRIDTPERLEKLLARLAGYPDYLAKHTENLREGMRAGRTAAKAVVERTLTQVRRAVDTPIGRAPAAARAPRRRRARRAPAGACRRARRAPGTGDLPRGARGLRQERSRRRWRLLAARRRRHVPLR